MRGELVGSRSHTHCSQKSNEVWSILILNDYALAIELARGVLVDTAENDPCAVSWWIGG
jgi:hypothetical protein